MDEYPPSIHQQGTANIDISQADTVSEDSVRNDIDYDFLKYIFFCDCIVYLTQYIGLGLMTLKKRACLEKVIISTFR